MQDLVIQGTIKTPSIEFKITGDLKIEGRSIPENTYDFYKPIINWVEKLKDSLPSPIILTVKLEYINTSSSILILDIFKILDEISLSKKCEVEIVWLYDYDDDESREEGHNYKSELSVPFNIKAY